MQRWIGVFYNDKLALRAGIFEIFVKTCVEVSAPQIVIWVVRFAVGQQGGIQNNKTRMRCVVLTAKFEKTNGKRRLRNCS